MEAQQDGGAPTWLFSFVDLAFLMLIALTQLAGDVGADPPDLGEIVVPRIGEQAAQSELRPDASRAWQLRVYPPAASDETAGAVFSLSLSRSASGEDEAVVRGDLDMLRDRVAEVFRSGANVPLLAPHENSRSRNLLEAAALLEKYWPTRRRALVARIAEI
jgi:hypothetical protein